MDRLTLFITSLFWGLLPVDSAPIRADRVFPNRRLIVAWAVQYRYEVDTTTAHRWNTHTVDAGTHRTATFGGGQQFDCAATIPRCRRNDDGCPHENSASWLQRHEPDDRVAAGLAVDRGVDADLGAVVRPLDARAGELEAAGRERRRQHRQRLRRRGGLAETGVPVARKGEREDLSGRVRVRYTTESRDPQGQVPLSS